MFNIHVQYSATDDIEAKRKKNKEQRKNVAKKLFAEQQKKQEAKKELLRNQSEYYRTGKVRNEAWAKVATVKNNASLSQVKGKVKGKTLRLWTNDKSVAGVDWTKRDFMNVVSQVKDLDDPIFSVLSELLSGLEDYDDFVVLSEYVREIFDISKQAEHNELNNDIDD